MQHAARQSKHVILEMDMFFCELDNQISSIKQTKDTSLACMILMVLFFIKAQS